MIIAREPESFVKYVTEHTKLKGKGKAKGRVKIVEGSSVRTIKYTDPKTGKTFEIPFPEEEESSGGNKNQVTQQFLYWYFKAIYASIFNLSCPCFTSSAPTPVVLVKNNGNVVTKLTPYIFIQVNSCSCFVIYVIASDTSNNSYTANCLVFCNYFIVGCGNEYTPLIPIATIQNVTITKSSTSYLGITWAISVQFNYNDPFLPYTPYLMRNTPGTYYGRNSNCFKYVSAVLSPQGNTTLQNIFTSIAQSCGNWSNYIPPNFPANSPAFQSGSWYLIPVLVNGVAYMVMWATYNNSAQPTVNGIMTGFSGINGGAYVIVGISVISQTPYQAPMPSTSEGVFGVVMLEAES